MTFDQSSELLPRFHALIPGGGHTYAKADDQFPASMAPFIVRGEGSHVWDKDGNDFIEYGSGLRAVTLGHAYRPVVEAAYRQMLLGSNFIRPATIELECAEEFLSFIRGAEMVKFGKNGSDVTSGAIKLSRAYTGRDLVAVCKEHPFFSVDDWFIGSTPMPGGIPQTVRDLTVKFHFNDISSIRALFEQHEGKIACLIMEAEKEIPPAPDFIRETQALCKKNGTVFVLDEMITGFRWHNGGAQAYYEFTPDLSGFGKSLGNGFSVSALAGKREIMQLGGLHHNKEKVFLMSYTHGAESHGLAAALAIMKIYRTEPVVETLWKRGERLAQGFRKAVAECHLEGYVDLFGKPCCMVYATRDEKRQPSQPYRTLFLQETMKRGILATSLVVGYSHTEADIDKTVDAIHEALRVYRKALDEGLDKYLVGRPVKPVFRKFN